MRTRILNLLTATIAVIAVAIVALWIRGIFFRDEIHVNVARHLLTVESDPAHLYFEWYRPPDYDGRSVELLLGLEPIRWDAAYSQPRAAIDYRRNWISVPHWLTLLVLLPLALWRPYLWIRRRSRTTHGLCPDCGYDLRCSSGRCPECGRTIDPSN